MKIYSMIEHQHQYLRRESNNYKMNILCFNHRLSITLTVWWQSNVNIPINIGSENSIRRGILRYKKKWCLNVCQLKEWWKFCIC